MPQIMTNKKAFEFLKLHDIVVCKYAPEEKVPTVRVERVWRFDKEALDARIGGGQTKARVDSI